MGPVKPILFIIAMLFFLSAPAWAGEGTGAVCLGPNLSVVLGDSDHVTISVGEHAGIRFAPDNAAHVVLSGLDAAKAYPVTVFYDGEPVESWTLDFRKLGSRMALIWRAKGGYRMASARGGKCVWLGM
jgi:hypothetical protein